MGHGSIAITLDRYGHLMPGNESDAAKLVDRYLAAATGENWGACGAVGVVKPNERSPQDLSRRDVGRGDTRVR
jgi:hypothetical protein